MQSDNATEPYAHVVVLLKRAADLHLGSGRIVVSEIELPNMFVNLI